MENTELQWQPIFRTGLHTDMSGRTRAWTVADLDAAVAGFDLAEKPPLVLGHPVDNAPAFGWVEGLRREGDVLLARLEPSDKGKALLDGKQYRYKSASFYRDGRLRHVGLLGAARPAVSGLGAVEFSADAEFFEYVMEEHTMPEDLKKQLEALRAEVDALKAENTRLKDGNGPGPGANDARIAALEEKLKQAEAERDKAQAAFAEAQVKEAKGKIAARVDGLIDAGKVMPADKSKVCAFAEALGQSGDCSFSESEGVKALAEHFFGFLEHQSGHGLFEEFSGPGAGKKSQANDFKPVDLSDRV